VAQLCTAVGLTHFEFEVDVSRAAKLIKFPPELCQELPPSSQPQVERLYALPACMLRSRPICIYGGQLTQ